MNALKNEAKAPFPSSPFGRWLQRFDRLIGWAVEIPTAALVVAEIALLFAGVVARYFLHAPLIWSDELASILFLWLAMLGAVVAFRREAHMRMTALAAKAPPSVKRLLETFAAIAPLLFLILILPPAYEFAEEERFITTPALEIANAWRAAALPTGFGLMLLLGCLRLAARPHAPSLLATLAIVTVILGIFLIGASVLAELGNLNLIVFFVGIVALCVFSGVPIAFSFALACFGYLSLTTSLPPMVLVGRMDEGMSHLILLSVPLFVFLGLLIEMTGMARAMVQFLASLLGHVRGGLSYVLIAAMYLVSGISGSKVADMAAVAPVLFPEMKARGAKPGDLVALLSATGAQTETIPPSLVLITIGSVTGVSIAALFTGGLLPGIVLAATLCCVVWQRYRHENLSHIERPRARVVARLLIVALPAIILPFIIRAAVMEGIATATEVSSIGIVYTLIVGLALYRRFDWSRLYPMLLETASLSGAILLIVGAATAMAWTLTQSGFSRSLAATMVALPGGSASFMAASIFTFVILGSVLEGIPAIVLFGPLLFPVARAVGIHEVHYAMVVILAMGLGLFAPPFGVGYYAACAIGRVSPDKGIQPIWGYLFALLIGIVLVACIPWISIGFL